MDTPSPYTRRPCEGGMILLCAVGKNAAYPPTFEPLQQDCTLPETYRLRPYTYLNRVIEQDQRCVKRRVNPELGCRPFPWCSGSIKAMKPGAGSVKASLRGWPRRMSSHRTA